MSKNKIISKIAKQNNISFEDVENEILKALYLSNFFKQDIKENIFIDEIIEYFTLLTLEKIYNNT